MRHLVNLLAVAALGSALAACSENGTSAPDDETVLEEVTPAAGTPDADPEGSITVRFSGPMGSGMEQYVDLHQGGIDGPVVPMSCEPTADRAALTCTPGQPLQPGTQYTIHIGGGMMDENNRPIEIEDHGMGMGGQAVTGEMMGGMHGGQPTAMMGPGWEHPGDGHLGMAFTFETV
jgi:hypothetical protein